jgi:hypothetical protein
MSMSSHKLSRGALRTLNLQLKKTGQHKDGSLLSDVVIDDECDDFTYHFIDSKADFSSREFVDPTLSVLRAFEKQYTDDWYCAAPDGPGKRKIPTAVVAKRRARNKTASASRKRNKSQRN